MFPIFTQKSIDRISGNDKSLTIHIYLLNVYIILNIHLFYYLFLFSLLLVIILIHYCFYILFSLQDCVTFQWRVLSKKFDLISRTFFCVPFFPLFLVRQHHPLVSTVWNCTSISTTGVKSSQTKMRKIILFLESKVRLLTSRTWNSSHWITKLKTLTHSRHLTDLCFLLEVLGGRLRFPDDHGFCHQHVRMLLLGLLDRHGERLETERMFSVWTWSGVVTFVEFSSWPDAGPRRRPPWL